MTKMKSNLTYKILSSVWHMDAGGLMVWREELMEFRKKVKGGEDIVHKARIITCVNMKNHKKAKLTRLLTNDLETAYEEMVATYDAR